MTARRLIRHTLQVALLGFFAWYLYVHWGDYEHVFEHAQPSWGALTLSCVVVLVSYVVLIQTWRLTVEAWGEQLSLGSATRIWFVSNLGKYVPGKYWSIAAMGTLAQEQGISPVAAVGSSLVVQLVNLATGFGVVALTGARVVDVPLPAAAGVVALVFAILAVPSALPRGIALLNRVTGRARPVPHLPPRAIWWAALGTTIAWLLYGVAFQLFARGISAQGGAGATSDWVAAFVASYLVGFIAVFAPGGIGAREVAMAEALQRTGLAGGALVALLVAGSRLWLTVLEIIPGLLLLLVPPAERADAPRRRPS